MENFRGFRDVQTASNQSHEQMLEHVETILDKQVNMGSNFCCFFSKVFISGFREWMKKTWDVCDHYKL